MTPLERYRLDLESAGFSHDHAQKDAVRQLQRVFDDLNEAPPRPDSAASGFLGRLRRRWRPADSRRMVKGLYLWGGVGRGKTYLVDTFFECLPIAHKKRIHFHRFMRKVHDELTSLKEQQDPLKIVGRRFADQWRVLCFDEFFVSDITDAMLLDGLLRAMFGHGVTMIATSNIHPENLYKDGLQRARFMPAIALLQAHMDVINVDGGVDYRLRNLEQAELYHSPLGARADGSLLETFERVAPESGHEGVQLEIEGREIETRRHADGVVWFDFQEICDGPRGTSDYIEIARCFHTVLVSNVPEMTWKHENQARRFLNMVDEFYDRNVKLVMSGETPLDRLYSGKKLQFEFGRALSRLKEMQSHDYLALEHLP